MKKQILNEKFSRMQKLAGLLKEGYAWERKAGKPLPTIQEVMDEYEAKKETKEPVQEIDAEGYSRMDGLVSQSDINSLVSAASNIIRDLKEDGFESEDIFDFIMDHIKTLD
jgi:ribosomal protein S25